jgi:hypothetical protein
MPTSPWIWINRYASNDDAQRRNWFFYDAIDIDFMMDRPVLQTREAGSGVKAGKPGNWQASLSTGER